MEKRLRLDDLDLIERLGKILSFELLQRRDSEKEFKCGEFKIMTNAICRIE